MILFAALLWLAQDTDPTCRPSDAATPVAQTHGKGVWIGGIAFSAEDIASAEAETDKYSFRPTIVLTFTPAGQRKFALAQRCGPSSQIDIWIDDDLIARPHLEAPILGPSAVISSDWTSTEAIAYAKRLKPPPATPSTEAR